MDASATALAERERRQAVGRLRRARTRARILAAAFDLFGSDSGLYARIEEIAQRAGITRATFYDHFTGMAELREALAVEVTHDFLIAVRDALSTLPDPRERAAAAIRFYLHRVRAAPRWGWSMVNLSASGVIFGAETHGEAEHTVQEGMAAGMLHLPHSALGRDLILGATLAAMGTMLRERVAPDYPEQIVVPVLCGLGVARDAAQAIAARPLPPLRETAPQT
ncbi:TetR family transcriptional regulator [Novosphingobium sp. FSY-8]|uniref:TetR family transcriptional regulator n=1 Tax=Novosphingobium ovatum TaxID=1908523 RepID=A0ABW9XI07_9SPHN|nr:TetR/AcrR family transcriptional regulator [Novosphingobium ovatum]NBC38131.1 TetR family transcriptional regulator [Novosphingobium ovatum]